MNSKFPDVPALWQGFFDNIHSQEWIFYNPPKGSTTSIKSKA